MEKEKGGPKTEADETDLQEAYDRARRIGLFLVENYARQALHEHPEYREFFMAMGTWGFIEGSDPDSGYSQEVSLEALNLIEEWDEHLNLTGEGIRFTADGPVEREW